MEAEQLANKCPECRIGYFVARNSIVKEKSRIRVRYYACKYCGYRPENNKVIVPLKQSPKRNGRH